MNSLWGVLQIVRVLDKQSYWRPWAPTVLRNLPLTALPPIYLSGWEKEKKSVGWELRKHQKKSIPDNCSSVFLAPNEKHFYAGN